MTRRVVLGTLAVLAASVMTAGCGLFGNHTYRYKITVEVETPSGVKSGFAVREVQYSTGGIKLPESSSVSVTQRGEAVAVDLPGGQTLFALLSVNGYETLQAAFGDDKPATLDAAKADRRIVDLKPKPESIPEQSGYPTLVRFKDVHDPKSVEQVKPDDLAASFGAGVRLKRITVQIVDEDVTVGIGKRLGWLGKYPEPSLDPDFRGSTHPNLSQQLSHGNFLRGDSK